jgi:hypothetical protein
MTAFFLYAIDCACCRSQVRIFSGIADCGVQNNIEISQEILNVGDNTLTFGTDLGSYVVEKISVKTELKSADAPAYY